MLKAGLLGIRGSGRTSVFDTLAEGNAFQADGTGRFTARATHLRPGDARLDRLAEIGRSRKMTRTVLELIDYEGVGLGDRGGRQSEWINTLQSLDLLVIVLPLFLHSDSTAGIVQSLDETFAELILADLEMVENRCVRIEEEFRRAARAERSALEDEQSLFLRLRSILESGHPLNALTLSTNESHRVRSFGFMTLKPLCFILNTSDNDVPVWASLQETCSAKTHVATHSVVGLSAAIELEATELANTEREDIMNDLGISSPPVTRMSQALTQTALHLTVYTVGENEARAWSIPSGSRAIDFAGTIHTDIAKRFIRAETVAFDQLNTAGSLVEAKKQGVVRQEARDYEVKDGDVMEVLFSK